MASSQLILQSASRSSFRSPRGFGGPRGCAIPLPWGFWPRPLPGSFLGGGRGRGPPGLRDYAPRNTGAAQFPLFLILLSCLVLAWFALQARLALVALRLAVRCSGVGLCSSFYCP